MDTSNHSMKPTARTARQPNLDGRFPFCGLQVKNLMRHPSVGGGSRTRRLSFLRDAVRTHLRRNSNAPILSLRR